MARKNRDIEILVKLLTQGNFDQAQDQLERLKKSQEGAAAAGAGSIGKLKAAWASWTSMAEVSAASIKKAWLTALGPIGLLIAVVGVFIQVFGRLIGFVKDYNKAQKEVNDTLKASADALAAAQRHKEKYADATGVDNLGKAIKAHQNDLEKLTKNYDDIKKKVEETVGWTNLWGRTNSEGTRSLQEQLALLSRARQETQDQVRAKEQQLEVEKDLKRKADERLKAETDISDRIAKNTLDDTALKERELAKQIAAYEKAGVDRDLIDQFSASEKIRFAEEVDVKRQEVETKIKERLVAGTEEEFAFRRQKLEEEMAAYAQAGADKVLIDQLRAAESARIDEQEVANKKRKADLIKAKDKEEFEFKMAILSTAAQFQNAKTKELAALGKAAAISETLIHTHMGAGKAAAKVELFPFNFVLAGLIEAAGLARVAQIAGIELEKGGVVPGSPAGTHATIGEKGKAEAVIPLEDPRALKKVGEAISGAGGAGGGSTVIFNNTFILPGLEAARDHNTIRAVFETMAEQLERTGDPAARKFAVTTVRIGERDRDMAT